MAGITNPPFRRLCKEHGASFTCTELISSHALVHLAAAKSRRKTALAHKTRALLSCFSGERPFPVQIFGRDPGKMAGAAEIAVELGADIVDLNFACPAKKVAKSGEGSGVALMRYPELLEAITGRVIGVVAVPVTAKIRAGWCDGWRNAPEVAKRLEGAGAQAICVHAARQSISA